MSRVAIVIVTHNSAAEIGSCLSALATLPDTEIVVVDNASFDHTRPVVSAHGTRLIANSTNTGFAAAVNQGVLATSAPFILILNPDAILQTILQPLIHRCELPGSGGAGGLLLGADGSPQTGFMARNLPTPAALIFESLGINRLWPRNPVNWHYRCGGFNPMTAAQVEQPAGAFFMFPRRAWLTIGGFDETFTPAWFEDVDFCARLKSAGLAVWYEPAAVAVHSGGHSVKALSASDRQRYWYGNLIGYAAKHYRPAAFRMVCAAVVLGALLRSLLEMPRSGLKSFQVFGAVAVQAAARFGSGNRSGAVNQNQKAASNRQ